MLDVASILQDKAGKGELPRHLLTSATIRGSADKRLTMNAVIDSDSPFVLILQLTVKEIGLKNGVVPLRKLRSIDENLLQIYLQYTIFVFITDSASSINRSEVIDLRADIGSFDLILRLL